MDSFKIAMLTIVISIAMIVGGITYYNVVSDRSYYEHANKCIEAGGSWIPTRTNISTYGICINRK